MVLRAEPSSVIRCSNFTSPNCPRRVPVTGLGWWFTTSTSTLISAREVSGSGSVADTNGFSSVTAPVSVRYTSPQMPVLRPRMVGIQSQPIEAW